MLQCISFITVSDIVHVHVRTCISGYMYCYVLYFFLSLLPSPPLPSSVGSVLHFLKPHLEDYYILSPQWWFNACALVISPNNVNDLIMAGEGKRRCFHSDDRLLPWQCCCHSNTSP